MNTAWQFINKDGKKMKTLKRLTAILLAVVMAVSAAGCSTKAQWSYKTQDDELAIGVYIYSVYAAYSQAQNLASSVEGYDSSKSFLDLEIQGEDDDEPLKAEEWIKEKADEMCRSILAVSKLCKDRNVTLSDERMKEIDEAAKSDWELGFNYQYYAAMGYASTPLKDILEPKGVSLDSFKQAYYTANELQYELFCNVYKVGGERAVADSELKDFFYDNYTSYKYISKSLSKSETGEDGNSTTVAMSDSEIKEIEDKFNAYADTINKGGKWDDVSKQYMTDNDTESDPTVSNTAVLEDSSLSDDLKDAIAKLKEGKASVVTVGSAESAVMYLVYKAPLADAEESSFGTDSAAEQILISYKSEEFADWIDSYAKEMDITVNSSQISKYAPKIFEK